MMMSVFENCNTCFLQPSWTPSAVVPNGPHTQCICACRKGWVLREFSRGPDDILTLQYDTPNGPKRLRTRSVSLTIPAHTAAALLQSVSSGTSSALSSIDYPPVAAVAVSYPMSAIREDRKDAAGTLPGGSGPSQRCVRPALSLFPGPYLHLLLSCTSSGAGCCRCSVMEGCKRC